MEERIYEFAVTIILIPSVQLPPAYFPGLTEKQSLKIGVYSREAQVITLYIPESVLPVMHKAISDSSKKFDDSPQKIVELYLRHPKQFPPAWTLHRVTFIGVVGEEKAIL